MFCTRLDEAARKQSEHGALRIGFHVHRTQLEVIHMLFHYHGSDDIEGCIGWVRVNGLS